jgi:hypothetical protein
MPKKTSIKRSVTKEQVPDKDLGGRPTIYTPEFIEALAPKMLAWFKKSKKHYYIKQFAVEQGIASRRLLEFTKTSEVFEEAYAMCKDIQECRWIDKGQQAYKDRFAIFILKNIAGMKDRTDITSDDEKVTAVEVTIVQSKRKA